MAMYQIECAYTCHTGNIRANNEDNFWCFGESLPVNNEGTKGICSKIISGNRVPAMAVFVGIFLMALPPVYLQDLPLTLRPLLSNGLLVGILLAVLMDNLIPWERIE